MNESNAPTSTRTWLPDFTVALNFRDMGGYVTNDGRRVRWNTLYRSGTTHAMADADLEQLARSGIRFAFDLRSKTERVARPSKLQGIADILSSA
jgi:protein-tyrosine phosphatase